MKKTGLLLGMATLLAAMSSCSKSEWGLDSNGSDKASASYLQVTGVDKEGYALTRGEDDACGDTEKTSFEDGDAMGVWVLDTSTADNTYNGQAYSNIKLTYDKTENTDRTWSFANPIPLTETKAKLYAVYPYKGNTSGTEVAISADDIRNYLYDEQEGLSCDNSKVGLNMKHLCSLLVVHLKRGTYTGKAGLDSLKTYGSSLCTEGSYNLMTKTFSAKTRSILLNRGGYVPEDKSKTWTAKWFVFTASNSRTGKLKFDIWIDGQKYANITSENVVSFEPGKKYVFTLIINEDRKVTAPKLKTELWIDDADEDITSRTSEKARATQQKTYKQLRILETKENSK